MDKQDVKNYVDTHATIFSSKDPYYKMVLTTAQQGLYSGIAYVNMSDTYRYVDFIIDFPGKEVTMRGFSTKKLKESTKNLGAIFDYGNFEASEEANNQEKEFVKNIKSIGSILGQVYPEKSLILGRGIIRAIKDFPVVELLTKGISNFKKCFLELYTIDDCRNNSSRMIYIISMIQQSYNKNESKSLRKILKLSKGEFKYFFHYNNQDIVNKFLYKTMYNKFLAGNKYEDFVFSSNKANVLEEAEECLEKFSESLKKYYEMSKVYDQNLIYQTCKNIDNIRGYHDSKEYSDIFINYIKNYVLGECSNSYAYFATSSKKVFEKIVNNKQDLEHLVQYFYGSLYHQQAIEKVEDQISLYGDYLDMVYKFKRFNKFPRYLKTAHDIAMRNYKEIDKDGENIFPQYLKHKNLEGTFGDWAMILMASSKEIVEEGNQQSNCVGSYVHYVNDGVSLILGMRKKESQDKSEVTLELQEGEDGLRAVQYYSTFNNALSKEEHDALVSWCNRKGIWIKDKSEIKYTGNFGKIDKSIHEDAEKEYQERLEKSKTFDINKGLENMPKAV